MIALTIFEQNDVLKSFEILCDSREQDTARARKRYASFGVPFKNKVTLSYGDYAYNATLPDGRRIYDEEKTIEPICCVERKMDLTELSNCFTHSRDRFQREFQRAFDKGCRIYLICENANWENLLNGKYRTKFNPTAFTASTIAWMVRYNMNLIFCKEETSGKIIKEILYRDLKERLERGEFG